MEEYELKKDLGKSRKNPDSKKTWKEFTWAHKKHTKNVKKHFRKFQRNKLQLESEEKNQRRQIIKIKDYPYNCEKYIWAKSPLLEAQQRRSKIFCSVCSFIFCEHKAKESGVLILHSQKNKDGDFAIFPKEIALILAKLIYLEQMKFLDSMNPIYIPHSSNGYFDQNTKFMKTSTKVRKNLYGS